MNRSSDANRVLDAVPIGPPVIDAVPADSGVLVAVPAPRERPAEVLTVVPDAPKRSFLDLVAYGVPAALEWLFGLVCVVFGLGILAAVPLLQILSLGYMLESAARVARSGRLRDGFVGVRLAARLGGIVIASWLLLLPVRAVADLARSAQIIDPGGRAAALWRLGLFALIGVTFVHIVAACARGGKLRYFVWPFNVIWLARRVFRGGYYTEARDAVWDTFERLRLPYYAWLGFRGFVVGFAWLALPVTLLAAGRGHSGAASLVGFVGALMLGVVLMYLPFLQLRMVAQNRLRAGFELLAVRREFRRAPWAFAFAFVITLLFAVPLYLLKIQIVPREAAWLPSLVFIAFIYPARILTGWAVGRANRRTTPRHWFFRWTGRLPFVPAAAAYVLIVFFTQYTSWYGVWSLYEQHAFLVPVPFVSL